jgi:putative acetyltransferase
MSKPEILIRPANLPDLPEMQTLFVDTIRSVCRKDYSKEKIEVWASAVNNTDRWLYKVRTQYFLVAELGNKIVGYASLENNDYIDFLYVHKDFQNQGIAGRLYLEMETQAKKKNAIMIHSDVSITARPFCERKGFIKKENQIRKIQGVEILNFKMVKTLL